MTPYPYRIAAFQKSVMLIALMGLLAVTMKGVAPCAVHHPPSEVMVSVKDIARIYQLDYSVHGKQMILEKHSHKLVFEGDSQKVTYNNIAFWLSRPVAKKWWRWTMLQSDVDNMIVPLLDPVHALRHIGCGIVVLDAGHGGADVGANNLHRGILEKQITLEIARKVQQLLKQQDKLRVVMTRSDDVQVTLENRCKLADQTKADVFVNIHLNSANNADPSGIETHIMPPAGCPITANDHLRECDGLSYSGNQHDGANMILGYMLQQNLVQSTRAEDRGVRRSRFYVIKNVSCPAALVECGFISHPGDAGKLLSPVYQISIAKAIAEGIRSYIDMVEHVKAIKP